MFCTRCGANLQADQRYCPACGTPVGGAPPLTAQPSRLTTHVRILGILWLVLSAYRLLPGLVLLTIFGRHAGLLPPEVPMFVPGLLRIIGSLFMLGALLGVIAGLGLLNRQPWARMLAIVLGCLSLLEVPFGTALGIYTLWVLLPARSEQEWRPNTAC